MSDALLPDDASQGSQRSALSGSLLERIRAQREAQQREPATATAPATAPAAPAGGDSSLEVTSYSPLGNDGNQPMTSNNHNHRWSLNVAWPTLGLAHGSDDASEALLSRDHHHDGDNNNNSDQSSSYSMGQYLKTFVQDFYTGFRSMHPVVQVVVVFVMLYVAFKLV